MTAYILKYIFYFGIISDIQESYKDSTESSYMSFASSLIVNLLNYHITFVKLTSQLWASLVAQMVKNVSNAGNLGSIPSLGRFPWRREWVATSVFLPGGFNVQKRLVGSHPWGHKESDMTERLTQANVNTLLLTEFQHISKAS